MTRKVIAWDVGVKNLSYCILMENGEEPKTKHGYTIVDWEVINLYSDEKEKKCGGLTRKKEICGKKAKMCESENYYCAKHSTDKCKKIPKTKNKNPFEYAIRIKNELDKRPGLTDVDAVIIENQPALVNPIMKTIQMILFSYFSFKYSPENPFEVKNINAKCKEKLPEKDDEWEKSEHYNDYIERTQKIKSKYSKRKLLCFYYSKLCLEPSPEMKEFLSNHKKQDDLTDSFLMCVDWLKRCV